MARVEDISILLFIGTNDYFVAEDDFKMLKKYLPADTEVVTINDYNHLDYMWGNDANTFVNNKIISFVEGLVPKEKEIL